VGVALGPHSAKWPNLSQPFYVIDNQDASKWCDAFGWVANL